MEVAQIHGAFQWFRDAACMSFYPVDWKIRSMNGLWFKRETGGYVNVSFPKNFEKRILLINFYCVVTGVAENVQKCSTLFSSELNCSSHLDTQRVHI